MNNLVEIDKARIDPQIVRALELALTHARAGRLFNLSICADCNDGTTWNITAGPVNIALMGVMAYTQARIGHYLVNHP